jgi:hypothetical protein
MMAVGTFRKAEILPHLNTTECDQQGKRDVENSWDADLNF